MNKRPFVKEINIETASKFRKVLDALEELEAISAYDEAKADPGELIKFELAIAEIESQRDEL